MDSITIPHPAPKRIPLKSEQPRAFAKYRFDAKIITRLMMVLFQKCARSFRNAIAIDSQSLNDYTFSKHDVLPVSP
jgi:hypothetical protein